MSQVSRPTAVTGAGWTGAYTTIADDLDATYVESDASPVAEEPLVVTMEDAVDPEVDTGHVLTVRVAKDDDAHNRVDVTVDLMNGATEAVIATSHTENIGATPQDIVMNLTEPEAALMNYGNIVVRVIAIEEV